MTTPYWLFGTNLSILIDEQQTHSQFDVIEGRLPAGTETPLHLHTKYDEFLYVLEGIFTVYTDSGTWTLEAGQHIFIPRNTPHVVAAIGLTINRGLTIASPSAFGKLIRTVGIPETDDKIFPYTANDMGLFIQLSEETGDIILGSPGARPTLKKKTDIG